MKEYEVQVNTIVKEIYVVAAESAKEASKNWSDGELAFSECIGIDDIFEPMEVEE